MSNDSPEIPNRGLHIPSHPSGSNKHKNKNKNRSMMTIRHVKNCHNDSKNSSNSIQSGFTILVRCDSRKKRQAAHAPSEITHLLILTRSKHTNGSTERYLLGQDQNFDVFGSCFRTLAVILVLLFFVCFVLFLFSCSSILTSLQKQKQNCERWGLGWGC